MQSICRSMRAGIDPDRRKIRHRHLPRHRRDEADVRFSVEQQAKGAQSTFRMLLSVPRKPHKLEDMNTDITNRQIQRKAYTVVVLGVLAALIAGCELDDNSTNSVTIYPASVLLDAKVTNTVEFTAFGGNNSYKWSMNNDILGSIYIANTNTAVALYQSTINIGTNIITVRDSSGESANARIVQE